MHTRKNTLSLLVLCGIYLSYAPMTIHAQQEPAEQSSLISPEEQELLEFNARWQEIEINTIKLVNHLRQIAGIVINKKSDVISNKEAAHAFITKWILAIEKQKDEIKKADQIGSDFNTIILQIGALADSGIACSADVTKAMRSNFFEAEFVEPTPDRALIITCEALDERIKIFQEQLIMLAKHSQSIGLTFTNKIVRKIDDFVSWCGKYHVGTGLIVGGGAAALATYLYWHTMCYKSCLYENDGNGNWIPTTELQNFDPKKGLPGSSVINGLRDQNGALIPYYIDAKTQTIALDDNGLPIPICAGLDTSSWSNNWLMKKVTDCLGMPARKTFDGSFAILEQDKGWLNQTDALLNNGLGQKFPPLFYFTGGGLLATGGYFLYNSIIPPLKKAFQNKWNQLRGGAYIDKPLEGVFEVIPTSDFNDIIGMDDYKERFAVLLDYCMHPEQYGEGKNVPVTNFAFTGPKRTGKTYFANTLFGQIQSCLQATGSSIKYRFLQIPGNLIAAHGVSEVMKLAREMAPCAIFVDEFDLCNPQRGGNHQFVIDALTELGNQRKNDPLKPIIFIVATNKPESIDTALFDPARLGEEVRFDYPCIEDRRMYIYATLQKVSINHEKFNIDRLAQKMDGKSFEDIERFIIAACNKARLTNQPITQDLFEECIDEVIRHIVFFNRKHIPAHEIRLLSAHFAGEALATVLLQDSTVFDMVTINAFMPKIFEEQNSGTGRPSRQPKILVGKTFTRSLIDSTEIVDRPHAINSIKCWLAGAVAEEIILGYPSSNQCDMDAGWFAFEAAKRLTFDGRYKEQLSDALYDKLSLQADELFMQCKQEVKELLEQHREQLDAIAYALMICRTLPDYAVAEIMQNPSIVYQLRQQLEQAQQA